MVNGVKGFCEVKHKKIAVLFVHCCIFQDGSEQGGLLGGGMVGSETCLSFGEYTLFLTVLCESSSYHISPDFVQGVLKPYPAIIV